MAVAVWPGVAFSSTGAKLRRIVEILVGSDAGYYITSSLRNTPGDHHGGRLSYGGSPTGAIDVGFGYGSTAGAARARKLAAALYAYSSDTVELIHTNTTNYYVKNGAKVGSSYYGATTNNAHRDHIHFAASSAQADRILARLQSSPPKPPAPAPTPQPPAPPSAVDGIKGNEAQVLAKIGAAIGAATAEAVWDYERVGTLDTDYEKDAAGDYTSKRRWYHMDHFVRYARDHAAKAKDEAKQLRKEIEE